MSMSAEYYHGDEGECSGYCGTCQDCDERYYQCGDEEYRHWLECEEDSRC